jgi:hypothetical protein
VPPRDLLSQKRAQWPTAKTKEGERSDGRGVGGRRRWRHWSNGRHNRGRLKRCGPSDDGGGGRPQRTERRLINDDDHHDDDDEDHDTYDCDSDGCAADEALVDACELAHELAEGRGAGI